MTPASRRSSGTRSPLDPLRSTTTPLRDGRPPSTVPRDPTTGEAVLPARRGAPLRAPRAAAERALDLQQRVTLERLLATARFVTAIVIFASLAANVGLLHPPSAKVITGAYVFYSAAILLIVRRRPQGLLNASTQLHGVDFGWAVLATSVSGGPSSHAFPLFAFVLVAAAYRWGLRRTVLDAGAIVVILVAQSGAAMAGLTPWPFELDWFVLWAAYVVVLAMLFGGLSERMQAVSFQAVALGRVMSQVGQSTGVASALRYTLREILRLFGGRDAYLVAEEADSARLFLWRGEVQASGLVAISNEEVTAATRQVWMFDLPPGVNAFEVRRADGQEPLLSIALDADGQLSPRAFTLPAALVADRPWRSLLGVEADLRHDWRARLYLTDPTARPGGQLRLGFLQNLVRQVTPVLLDLYLLRGLRARAESRERARLSRELHDGVIQSLVALEMRMDVLRRDAESLAPSLGGELAGVRDLLHEEALQVRELMQRLRYADLDAQRLPYELEDLVERFSRQTGIEAHLVWAVRQLGLSPRECREVSFIVQEALVNVRRHSRASKVTVRVEADAERWGLIVEDNGCGLGFTGRLEDAELDARSTGPRVIHERVTALGGSLGVDSSDDGTRLEMTFPLPRQD